MKVIIYKNGKAYKTLFLETHNYTHALDMAEHWVSLSCFDDRYTADIIITSEKVNNNVLTM